MQEPTSPTCEATHGCPETWLPRVKRGPLLQTMTAPPSDLILTSRDEVFRPSENSWKSPSMTLRKRKLLLWHTVVREVVRHGAPGRLSVTEPVCLNLFKLAARRSSSRCLGERELDFPSTEGLLFASSHTIQVGCFHCTIRTGDIWGEFYTRKANPGTFKSETAD